jgi:PAS domain S-box-containing protein
MTGFFKKQRLTDSYEIEIKISLILLVGFLLSLNIISSFALTRARIAQQNDHDRKLDLVLEIMQKTIELNNLILPDRIYLNDLMRKASIHKIEVSDSLGTPVLSLCSPGTFDETKIRSRNAVIHNKNKQPVYQVSVKGMNIEGENLARLALIDKVFRIAGLLASLIVAFLFIRTVMNPYRKIKREASRLNLPHVDFDKADSIEYAVRVFQEIIRELKQKESLLQAMYDSSEKRADSLARYNEYILGSISSGVIICDNQGIITRFNRTAEKIFDIDKDDSQGKHYGEIFGKKHQISKVLGEALFDGKTYSRTEFEIYRKSGDKLWIGLTSSQIFDNEDKKIGAAVLLTDLTEIKKLQEISDFTEKMAALGEMSAGLAHELRNSVAAIMGFARLMHKQCQQSGIDASIASMIISEAIATEEMLSKFLDFARPLKINYIRVKISEILANCIRMASEMYQDKDIKVTLNDDSGGIDIYGDAVLLKNALSNLIINAYQAMDQNGVVRIDMAVEKNNRQLKIAIADNGGGIAEENLSKIFNPFFTTKEKGAGLGLAIVRKIIIAHGGTIEVESRREEGTKFTVVLPIYSEFSQIRANANNAEIADNKQTTMSN